jgi:hypothetical protein
MSFMMEPSHCPMMHGGKTEEGGTRSITDRREPPASAAGGKPREEAGQAHAETRQGQGLDSGMQLAWLPWMQHL